MEKKDIVVFGDLQTALNNGYAVVVRFKPKIVDFEGYFDANMLATVTQCRPDPSNDMFKYMYDWSPMTIVTFNVKEHDEHNQQFENNNYYDENECACLTARQAGLHPEKSNWNEKYWFKTSDKVDTVMEILEVRPLSHCASNS